MTKVPVVVLNYNGEHLLGECLESLRRQQYAKTDVWVLDNGSTDAFLQVIRQQFPWVKLLAFGRNYGVSKGYNMGLAHILRTGAYPYFATLNNDTKVHEGWLAALVDAIGRHEDAWAIASKVMFLHEPEKIDSTGSLLYRDGSSQGRGHCELDQGQYEREEEVFGACLVAALIRRSAWEMCGGFENIFFAYNEEVDLNWRMRLRGWKVYYSPQAVVSHVHSANFRSYSLAKVYYTERNRIWHAVRNLPLRMLLASPYYTAVRYGALLHGAVRRRGAAAQVAERAHPAAVMLTLLKAWAIGLALLPVFLLKRIPNQLRRRVSWREINVWHERFGVDVDTLCLLNRNRLHHQGTT